jgi:hypothetical protein
VDRRAEWGVVRKKAAEGILGGIVKAARIATPPWRCCSNLRSQGDARSPPDPLKGQGRAHAHDFATRWLKDREAQGVVSADDERRMIVNHVLSPATSIRVIRGRQIEAPEIS